MQYEKLEARGYKHVNATIGMALSRLLSQRLLTGYFFIIQRYQCSIDMKRVFVSFTLYFLNR